MGYRLLEGVEVPVFCSHCACKCVPEAPLGPRHRRTLRFPISAAARAFVLGALVGARLLEDLKVRILGITRALYFVPGVPVGPRPLQHREVPAACRERTEHARKNFSRDLDIALWI